MSDFEMLDDNRLKSFPYQGLNNYPQQAKNVRDKFKDYLISPEALILKTKLRTMYIHTLLKNIPQRHFNGMFYILFLNSSSFFCL